MNFEGLTEDILKEVVLRPKGDKSYLSKDTLLIKARGENKHGPLGKLQIFWSLWALP